ncbi:glycosyltransferase [Staphylococcus gallinarum]|uniref:Glycosyltransferase n=1 Tax=Staphylococcus gallinarum TaxID=1293 RepID=A0A380FL61_STAGA|nr:glycosyltransferase [Staphylococcus gallinarum]
MLADKSYYYATRREGEHMEWLLMWRPKDYYQAMQQIVRAIVHSKTLNRH